MRRLPRLALLLFCAAYVLPGFLGRGPWKNEDIAAFGVMRELASTVANWLQPQLLGRATEFDALAPYWLGAVAIKWLPFLDPALAVRVPFVGLLVLTLLATWYAVYYLARSPLAQPVAFAFGGEASPVDYARAIADAGLLALIASLGLAQLSHETTPALAQLGFTALAFYAMAASPYRRATKILGPAFGLLVGLAGLTLSGAPTLALLLGVGGALVEWTHMHWGTDRTDPAARQQSWHWVLLITGITLGVALLAYSLDLWRWRIHLPGSDDTSAWKDWRSLGRLLLWFTWPAWPLAMWTLYRWRRQLASRHVALPLWFAAMAVAATLTTTASDRSLLLSLPPLAALAAFALPTLKRSVASLIDWFTLLFFTGCGIIIWVVWIAQKALAAVNAGLVPVVCVGETLEEREAGKTADVVGEQLDAVLEVLSAEQLARIVLAYEPVWAIGTGKTATPEMAQEVHALLRARVAKKDAAAAAGMQILYGGSMKPENAKELLAQPDIDGGLIGGAALKAADFLAIIGAA